MIASLINETYIIKNAKRDSFEIFQQSYSFFIIISRMLFSLFYFLVLCSLCIHALSKILLFLICNLRNTINLYHIYI